MGIDAFLDTSSLINECASRDYKMFDGGRGESIQDVCEKCRLGSPETVGYLELLDVWQDGCRWGHGGLAFGFFNCDLLKHVHPRTGGPPLRHQGARTKRVVRVSGIWVGFAEFVNHLVDEL